MSIKSSTLYSIWKSVHLHSCCSQLNYNALYYNFKVRLPLDYNTTYKDRYVYKNLGDKLTEFVDGVYFSIANMNKGLYYIRDADLDHYYNFMKIHDGLSYWFGQELKWIISKRLSLPKYEDQPEKYFISLDTNNLAQLVVDYKQNNLSLQTIVIFQKLFKLLDINKFDDILNQVALIHFLKKTSTLIILGDHQKQNIMASIQNILLSNYPSLSNLLGNKSCHYSQN